MGLQSITTAGLLELALCDWCASKMLSHDGPILAGPRCLYADATAQQLDPTPRSEMLQCPATLGRRLPDVRRCYYMIYHKMEDHRHVSPDLSRQSMRSPS